MNLTALDALTAAFQILLHATWQAAILALIVLVATRCLRARLRASFRFALWLLVFARLAIPWIPSAPWSLYIFLPNVEPRKVAPKVPTTADGDALQRVPRSVDQPSKPHVTRDDAPHFAAQVATGYERVPSHESDRAVASPVWMTLPAWRWAALVWLAGLALLAFRRAWLTFRIGRWRASWPAANDPGLCALLQQCRNEARVGRAVLLQVASQDIGPAACGVFSPAIVLPQRLIDSLKPCELRLVLLHELIHVRRHDGLVDHVAWALACVHWFNPAAWLALAGLRHERELACDAALLDLMGRNARRDYGSVLLKAIELLQSGATALGAPAMFERWSSSDDLERRIQMIANYRPATRRGRLIGGMLLVPFALSALTDAGGPQQQRAKTGDEKAQSASPTAGDKKAADVLPLDRAERAAAERIRALGGWYELDADRHVTEVNMVYHEDLSGEREENVQKTDEALAHLIHFPHLKRLLLADTQASDDGLEFVGRLSELEELLIWDAETITDDGIAHLRALPKLRFLHLNGAAITDEAVAHLSKVPSIETLSLDGNALTDESLEYASRLPRLRDLNVGNFAPGGKETWITAQGLEHVRKMPMLEQLTVPYKPIPGQDLKPLHGLRRLELLSLENVFYDGAVNEAAIFDLQRTAPQLKVLVDGKVYPSLKKIVAATEPDQQKLDRRAGLEGLKTLERFLELVSAKRDAEALKFGDREAIIDLRRQGKEGVDRPFEVSTAHGDGEAVLAVIEPPITFKLYELDGQKRHIVGERTAHFVLKAFSTDGAWRVKSISLQEPGSDELVRRFLSEYPGAQDLREPAPPSKP